MQLNQAEEIVALKARIDELEDALVEISPFAACFEVLAQTTLSGRDEQTCKDKAHKFKRDTLYMNKFAYRRAAKLVKDKLVASGASYIFEA